MVAAEIAIITSDLPMQLPNAASRQIVTYNQRLAPYYSHLGKLISEELRENIVQPRRKLHLTPKMGKVFQAILLHAAHYSPKELFNAHPQSTLMQKLIRDTFGVEYEGSQYLECLYAIGESFWDEPADLNDEAKRKLASFTYNFAERITTLVRASTNSDEDVLESPAHNLRVLPFMKYLWVGEYAEPTVEPKHISIPLVERLRAPRIQMIRQSVQNRPRMPHGIVVPRDPEVITGNSPSTPAAAG